MNTFELNKVLNIKQVFDIKNQSEKILKLSIYGFIGGWRNSAQNVLQQIENADVEEINVHINSGGGSAFDGIAIGNILKNHKAKVIIHIDGWAASAASIIAMAGDEIIMPSNTMLMIHQASTFEYGNASVFEKAAKDLRKVDKAVTASYRKRFVGSDEELTELLNDETWLNADEAVALGFADKVADEIEIEELEEEQEEPENIKESLVAKYAAQQNNEPPKPEPTPSAEPKQNMSKLFLNLK
ncbi:Clp protease ClpP [Oceanobacillus kimchii]|uniref:head maturation protease, ClpP-related n=1 Tax=Oceanobacillus kimchii TaxID=746691 RepID=UPI0021A721FD|nr:head maturation protease, ClpP-related [Oceanobacillus kimchii]MCT1577541.1 Clp protease ClpP [Oceanobacillus kimchii]MCT2136529.1 Clp protease ClpP [Oceanobacillus kimchii]